MILFAVVVSFFVTCILVCFEDMLIYKIKAHKTGKAKDCSIPVLPKLKTSGFVCLSGYKTILGVKNCLAYCIVYFLYNILRYILGIEAERSVAISYVNKLSRIWRKRHCFSNIRQN